MDETAAQRSLSVPVTIACPQNSDPPKTVPLTFHMCGLYDTGNFGNGTYQVRCGGSHPSTGPFQQLIAVAQGSGSWSTSFTLGATPQGQSASLGAQLQRNGSGVGSPVGPISITIAVGGTDCGGSDCP